MPTRCSRKRSPWRRGSAIRRQLLDAELRHAELLARRGDVERAQAVCERAVDAVRRLRDPRATAAAARTAAMVARERGDFTRAEERLAAAESALRDHARPGAHRRDRRRARGALPPSGPPSRDDRRAESRVPRAVAASRKRAASPTSRAARGVSRAQFIDVVRRWGQSIEAKDLNTHGHCERVADLACAIAERDGRRRARPCSGTASARCSTTSASS